MTTQEKFRAVVDAREKAGLETKVMILRPAEMVEIIPHYLDCAARIFWYNDRAVIVSSDENEDRAAVGELSSNGCIHYGNYAILCKAGGWLEQCPDPARPRCGKDVPVEVGNKLSAKWGEIKSGL